MTMQQLLSCEFMSYILCHFGNVSNTARGHEKRPYCEGRRSSSQPPSMAGDRRLKVSMPVRTLASQNAALPHDFIYPSRSVGIFCLDALHILQDETPCESKHGCLLQAASAESWRSLRASSPGRPASSAISSITRLLAPHPELIQSRVKASSTKTPSLGDRERPHEAPFSTKVDRVVLQCVNQQSATADLPGSQAKLGPATRMSAGGTCVKSRLMRSPWKHKAAPAACSARPLQPLSVQAKLFLPGYSARSSMSFTCCSSLPNLRREHGSNCDRIWPHAC